MDAEELDKHLKETPGFIRRWRGRIIPGSVGYTENPTFGGFGPSSPVDEGAMEMADMEAAFIGNLARYCMDMGSVPLKARKGFYWVHGVCRGMKNAMIEDEFDFHGNHTGEDVLAPIQDMVDHLRTHLGAVLDTEGVQYLLKAGQETRWYSLKAFPQEDDSWLTEQEAMDRTGRTVQTLREWRRCGGVEYIKDMNGILYRKIDLDLMMEIKRGNMLRAMNWEV